MKDAESGSSIDKSLNYERPPVMFCQTAAGGSSKQLVRGITSSFANLALAELASAARAIMTALREL